MFNKFLILIIGGSAGTLCRYWLADWGQSRFGTWLPYGTLIVNLLGCFIMGLLIGIFENRYHAISAAPLQWRLFCMTGFLGAMTTFSSYELEALLFLRQGAWERALIYLGGSIFLGISLMFLGLKLGQIAPK